MPRKKDIQFATNQKSDFDILGKLETNYFFKERMLQFVRLRLKLYNSYFSDSVVYLVPSSKNDKISFTTYVIEPFKTDICDLW